MHWEKFISKRVLLLVRDKFLTGGGPKIFARFKIGYGDSYLDSVFHYSKVFRLRAILHDAAGAVRLQTSRGPGYCYMIRRGPNCCAWSRDWILFCLWVKIFLHSIFNLVDFRNSLLFVVLEIELTEKTQLKKWDFLLMVLYKDFHFVRRRLFNQINRQHGTQVIYTELRWVVKICIMRSSLLFLRHKSNECRIVW